MKMIFIIAATAAWTACAALTSWATAPSETLGGLSEATGRLPGAQAALEAGFNQRIPWGTDWAKSELWAENRVSNPPLPPEKGRQSTPAQPTPPSGSGPMSSVQSPSSNGLWTNKNTERYYHRDDPQNWQLALTIFAVAVETEYYRWLNYAGAGPPEPTVGWIYDQLESLAFERSGAATFEEIDYVYTRAFLLEFLKANFQALAVDSQGFYHFMLLDPQELDEGHDSDQEWLPTQLSPPAGYPGGFPAGR
ncbi:MAG: hypothetical protein LBT47_01610 [Deltaproteobacteria bacterium]|nr:hypothetical protein [Deltaproteobacteria bacterium]